MGTLYVTYADGTTETIPIRLGSAQGARCVPARIGRRAIAGASVTYWARGRQHVEPRRIVLIRGRYYTRTK